MKRKLCALVLSCFAVVLLMGAGVEGESPAAEGEPPVMESEPPVSEAASSIRTDQPAAPTEGAVYPTEPAPTPADPEPTQPDDPANPPPEGTGDGEEEPVPVEDYSLLVDGEPVPLEVSKTIVDGVTYVSLKVMSQVLDPAARIGWDEEARTVTVTTERLVLTAVVEQQYIVANDRYLYLPEGVQVVDGQTMVPLKALAKAFDAQVAWDEENMTVLVTTGSGAILPGGEFYNADDLFWLSRVIYAESGNQCLEGRMAVGNVVLNRVNSELFPDTILEVLSQKNQFSTYRSGKLANRTPNKGSIIAAMLVLDGGVVEEVANALYFDASPNSWAARHRTCVAVIEDHKFYE